MAFAGIGAVWLAYLTRSPSLIPWTRRCPPTGAPPGLHLTFRLPAAPRSNKDCEVAAPVPRP